MGGICSKENEVNYQQQQQLSNKNSIEWKKIEYYFGQIYGKYLSDQAQNWINQNFDDGFSSKVYLLNNQILSSDKTSLMNSLKKAYDKNFIVKSLNLIDKIGSTVNFQWSVEIPSPSKPDQRITIYYKTKSVFLLEKWISSEHTQYRPQQQYQQQNQPIFQAKKKSYWEKAFDRMETNMEITNNIMQYNYGGGYSSTTSTSESNQRFYNNLNKQKNEWNNHVRQNGGNNYWH
ncbi:hypothetical protein PPERSA_11578 [Pseudocohnilembus persalinus]|uniref:Uncharacterized protein n=1 Tax=Pseudocohnilembus persalinus TaxID=266149 RepID=A0A0V0Q9X6_PSEPJ|nr:hypothetical protein PPERSA_11578 [Pseudocohnilembus persalinus]|eukprot:KRW98977.1 hypothetical protein PPERSA_11578 [Pseudocohnilembus persalinus]